MAQGNNPLVNVPTAQVPAHLLGRQKRGLVADALQGLGGNNPPHISIKQNRFTLVNAAGQEWPIPSFELDVVIIDVNPNVSKIYYADAYDPMATEFKPPTCFSDNGPETTGVAQTPSLQAQFPQNPTCPLCPHNAWGSETSKVSGKAVKACNDLKKIAVIVPMDTTRGVYLLRVPPATLKNFRNYGKTVDSQGVDLPDVITRLTFDPKVQGVLNFQPVGWIDEVTMQFIDTVLESKVTENLVGKTDRPRNDVGQIAAPAAAPQLAAPTQPGFAPPQPVAAPASFTQPSLAPAGPAPMTGFAQPAAAFGDPAQQHPSFGSPPAAQMPPPQPVQAPASFMQPSVPQAPVAAPKTRKRRTKAEIAAEQGTAPQAAAPSAVPAFMQQAPAQAPPAFAAPQAPMAQPQPAAVPGFVPPQAQAAPAFVPPQQPAAPQAGDPLAIPAFLQRNPQPEAPKPVFGMQEGAPAPDAIAASLDKAFSLPT